MAKWIALYCIIVAGVVFAYGPTKELMIRQDAWVQIVRSAMSVNLFLFLFMWGVVSERVTKGMPRKKGWIVWGIGLAVIIGTLRLAGLPTIFG